MNISAMEPSFEEHGDLCRTVASPPKAPEPSTDPGVVPQIHADSLKKIDDAAVPSTAISAADLEPLVALRILTRGVQALADLTGDVPPSPAISRPGTPPVQELREESKTHSRTTSRPGTPSNVPSHDIQSVMKKLPIGSPEAKISEPIAIGAKMTATRPQHEAVARKFFSKRPPPVSITDYLLRMQRYCPMSTGVYLAAGVYIHRLAMEEHVVPVTQRTVHRLMLASLRVAMKALEDLSYPHKRFAGVGGVSEKELAKLEVALCYLMDFDLRVDIELLQETMVSLQQLTTTSSCVSGHPIKLKLPVRKRTNLQQIVC